MAWQIPIANTNAYTDLTRADSLYVSKPIVIGTVYADGSNQQVLVDGTIASDQGILFSSQAEHGNNVTVYSTGIVRGLTDFGIAAISYQFSIINHGYIAGGNQGILFRTSSDTTTSTIANDGTIEGGQYGIDRSASTDLNLNSTEALSLTNTGTITGGKFSYGHSHSDSVAVDIIVNKGTMNGAVDLGGGNDRLDTSAGRINGVIDGGDGNDTVIGSAYADTILGGKGNDIIKGGAGNDLLTGGTGLDHLWGGTGADTFVYKATIESVATTSRDVIEDFSAAQDDRVDIRGIDADTTVAGNQAFHFIGTAAFGHHAGELRYAVAGTSVIVSGDINGDGKADFSIELAHVSALVAGDFLL